VETVHPYPTPPPRPAAEQPVDAAAVTADIEDAVEGLHGLEALPLAEHVDRFDNAHAALTDALSRIDKV
jgi:hypothetical protein